MWLAGPIVAATAGAALASVDAGTRIDAWTANSRVVQNAVRYMPRTAGMIAAIDEPASESKGALPSTETAVAAAAVPQATRTNDRGVWDLPMAQAWPAEHDWTPAYEEAYGRFVTTIARGFAEHRCGHLDDCLMSPRYNVLYDASDIRLGFMPDCADLPYILRGYFSFKQHLPFGFVAVVGNEAGGDPRYLNQGLPLMWRTWTDFSTPRRLFERLPDLVHSGMFRYSPKVEDGDTYSTRVDRTSIHPGTMYYDPNGHVLVVSNIKPDGSIEFIDGHIGGWISFRHMDDTYHPGAGLALWGGGFRNWRTQRVVNGAIERDRNWQIADFDPFTQYDESRYVVEGQRVRYDQWVRHSLRTDL
jgi:hypothetical protein